MSLWQGTVVALKYGQQFGMMLEIGRNRGYTIDKTRRMHKQTHIICSTSLAVVCIVQPAPQIIGTGPFLLLVPTDKLRPFPPGNPRSYDRGWRLSDSRNYRSGLLPSWTRPKSIGSRTHPRLGHVRSFSAAKSSRNAIKKTFNLQEHSKDYTLNC